MSRSENRISINFRDCHNMGEKLNFNSKLMSAIWQSFRPKTLTAAIVPIIVGTSMNMVSFKALWWISILALLSAICIQIGTNLINDAKDFEKGVDNEQRLGPLRLAQSGILSPQKITALAFLFFGLAVLFGIPLVLKGGMTIVVVGLLSLLCGYLYTGGPYPLAYHGLGELFVIIFFGIVAVVGVDFLFRDVIRIEALLSGVQVGLLCSVLIAINNFRDMQNDRSSNKKTLAVRFGASFARLEIAAFLFVPYLIVIFWSAYFKSFVFLLPILALFLGTKVFVFIAKNEPSPVFNKFLALSSAHYLFFGILSSIAWVSV